MADRRFSPACAGNGTLHYSQLRPGWVQPRVCGERRGGMMRPPRRCGSAPRVRGTVQRDALHVDAQRFSPACAGNGSEHRRSPRRLAVQPRVCGERGFLCRQLDLVSGSAPRVRGTARLRDAGQRPERFSPACAGNGPTLAAWAKSRPVQPRVCGERRATWSRSTASTGSAPRVRGTGDVIAPTEWTGRFSPACAGNGSQPIRPAWPVPVQPRVCGERVWHVLPGGVPYGSAPRVRGTGASGR